jgi:hypothetical protein
MNGLDVSRELLKAREAALNHAFPDRKHEPQGIGDVPNLGCAVPKTGTTLHETGRVSLETFNFAIEFISDLASPEGYGHAVSPEVVRRAARILAMLRPKEPPRCGIGYEEPPPARCQKCDEE